MTPSPPGQRSLAWLEQSAAFRNGRASVREQLAADHHAAGMTRAADQEYQRARDIREGRE